MARCVEQKSSVRFLFDNCINLRKIGRVFCMKKQEELKNESDDLLDRTAPCAIDKKTLQDLLDKDVRYSDLPTVIIIGKPNVGKSTLFNRLLHKRRSITEPTECVTRDPIEEVAILEDKPVLLIDSAGFLPHIPKNKDSIIDELAREKTLKAIEDADKLLLLLDATSFTHQDEEFIELLRPYSSKLIVAVNKTEGGRYRSEAYNFLQKGFKHIIFISAEHGENMGELISSMLEGLDFSKVKKENVARQIKISIVGKPNVGKSTLSNFLTKTDASIVTDIAGTTRDVIEGSFSHKGYRFILQDTAGIRKKASVKENIEYYAVKRALASIEKADVVFHLIDVHEGLSEQDKKICFAAADKGVPIIFVLNKCDEIENTKRIKKENARNIQTMFGKMSYAPIISISAKTGDGVNELLNMAITLNTQLNRKIETSALNLALKDWITKCPPPSKPNMSFKLKYLVQKSVHPVEFLVFANKKEMVSESYLRYLQNSIRRDLGFSSIPILLSVRASRAKWEER